MGFETWPEQHNIGSLAPKVGEALRSLGRALRGCNGLKTGSNGFQKGFEEPKAEYKGPEMHSKQHNWTKVRLSGPKVGPEGQS